MFCWNRQIILLQPSTRGLCCFRFLLEPPLCFCWNPQIFLLQSSTECFFWRISTGGFSFFRFFCWTWQCRSTAASRRRGRRGCCNLQAWWPHAGTCVYWSCSHGERRRGGMCGWRARVAAVVARVAGKHGKPRASAVSRPACVQSGMCAAPFSPFFNPMFDFSGANSFIVRLQIVVSDVRAATGPNLGRRTGAYHCPIF